MAEKASDEGCTRHPSWHRTKRQSMLDADHEQPFACRSHDDDLVVVARQLCSHPIVCWLPCRASLEKYRCEALPDALLLLCNTSATRAAVYLSMVPYWKSRGKIEAHSRDKTEKLGAAETIPCFWRGALRALPAFAQRKEVLPTHAAMSRPRHRKMSRPQPASTTGML